MAGVTVRELLVRIGVVADVKNLDDFDDALESVKENAVTAVTWVAGLGAAVAGLTGALFANSAAVVDEVAGYEKLALVLGSGVDEAREYADGFRVLGVEANDVGALFGGLGQKIGEVNDGSAAAVDVFKALHIAQKDLKDLDLEEALARVADGLLATSDPVERLNHASTLFGGDLAQKVLPVLSKGRAGLDEMRASVRALGGQIGTDGIAKAHAFRSVWQSVTGQLQATRREVGLALLPVFTDLLTRAEQFISMNRGRITSGIARAVEEIEGAVTLLDETIQRVDRVVVEKLGGWENVLIKVGAAAATLATVFTGAKLIAWVPTLVALAEGLFAIAGALSVPAWAGVAVVALAIVALYLALEDLGYYLAGGQSALGDFLEFAKTGGGVLGQLAILFENIVDLSATMALGLLRVASIAGQVLAPMLGFLGSVALEVMQIFGNAVESYVLPPLQAAVALVQGINQVFRASSLGQFARGAGADQEAERVAEVRANFAGGLDRFNAATNLRGPSVPQTTGGAISSAVQNTVNLVINGNAPDPQAIADEIEAVMRRQYESTVDEYRGGNR